MKPTYSTLMQSKFFNPAFNSAIFDGPIRIYFSQAHESQALKIYFCLQQKYLDLVNVAKEIHKKDGRNLLIMLYPDQEAFGMSFEPQNEFLAFEKLAEDSVLGISGPFEDEKLPLVLEEIVKDLRSWDLAVLAHPAELTL